MSVGKFLQRCLVRLRVLGRGDGSEPDEAERFVIALFRGILRREPDLPSLRSLADAIRNGRSQLSVTEDILACQEFHDLAKARFFVPPGHYYSPIVDPTEAARYLDAHASPAPPQSLPGIPIAREDMVRTWHALLPYLTTAPFPDEEDRSSRFAFNNPSYSFGDGSTLHAMLRLYRPKRIIEIGSGWSSACTFDTVERYLEGNCDLTFIEPYPELLRERLGRSVKGVRLLEMPVQQVDPEIFDALRSGDILFIDSTHVLRTGSDVCFELFEVLPRLAPGVLVHFHDMFWPFEYPRAWVVDENRSWNELYALRAYLMDNPSWRIVFFNDYFAQLERSLIEATYPKFLRNPGGALWLQRQ